MVGPLKNARHERFAQELAKGKSQEEAYRDAGYRGDRTAASRLATKDNIGERVTEIKERIAENAETRAAIDAAWVLRKAAELHDKALKEKQLSVAKGALDIIGKHVDVQAFREQVQHSGLIEYKNLSDEEIAARIAAHEAARANGDKHTTH